MEEPQARRIPVALIAGVSAVIVVVAGGTAWWSWKSSPSDSDAPTSATSEPSATVPSPQQSSPQATAETTARIYWLEDTGTSLELVPNPVRIEATSDEPGTILTEAFQRLLEQPQQSPAFSTIPPGTRLQNLEVKQDGVHINLSQEFTTGGGSASMTGRLAQVVYTATTLDKDTFVWISVEGEPLQYLGGEGLEIPQPITRQQFEAEFAM